MKLWKYMILKVLSIHIQTGVQVPENMDKF